MQPALLLTEQPRNHEAADLTEAEVLAYQRVMSLAADYAKKAAFEQRHSRAIRRHGFAIIANPWCTLWRMFSKRELSIEDVKACLCRGYVIPSLIGE